MHDVDADALACYSAIATCQQNESYVKWETVRYVLNLFFPM